MKKYFMLFLPLFFYAIDVYAVDPIGWQLNQNFPDSVFTHGGSHSITYTLRNQLPIALIQPLIVEKSNNAPAEFSYTDNCSGMKLASLASCTVTVTLTPVTNGVKSNQLTIAGYSSDRVPLPAQTVTATQNNGIQIEASTLTSLPNSMTLNAQATYRFQFTNQGTADATGVSVSTNVTGALSNCTNTLAAGSSCEIGGNFRANSLSGQTITASFQFNQGPNVNQSTTTHVTNLAGLTANALEKLPSTTQLNTVYPVSFQFYNASQTSTAITSASVSAPQFTQSTNDCPNGGGNLAANAHCTITGNFNSANPGSFSLIATIISAENPPQTASTVTNTQTINPTQSGRTITFDNRCNFPIWFSLNGANRQNNQIDIPCNQQGVSCPQGSVCNPNAGANGLCFWQNYGPDNNNYRLNQGESRPVFIPDNSLPQDQGVVWSGNFSGRTGCNGTTCLQAHCQGDGGNAACAPGVGFSQPATQAEITMLNTSSDTYDIEVINGFHLPIQMKPTGGTVSNYNCGSPGNPSAGNNFGACNWNNATVPNEDYYWVSAGGASCASDPDSCNNGQLCGLDIGINKVCGNFLGFWTANEACNINKTQAKKYFQCTTYLGAPFPVNTYTLSDLYGCKTPDANQATLNSCYRNDANTSCCGCANWQDLILNPAIQLPPAPITENCLNTNSTWLDSVQSSLLWMKQACPNYYTYPFDDKSSTFTCSNGSPNTVDYTITFCPGGNTGLPAGVNEGRTG